MQTGGSSNNITPRKLLVFWLTVGIRCCTEDTGDVRSSNTLLKNTYVDVSAPCAFLAKCQSAAQ